MSQVRILPGAPSTTLPAPPPVRANQLPRPRADAAGVQHEDAPRGAAPRRPDVGEVLRALRNVAGQLALVVVAWVVLDRLGVPQTSLGVLLPAWGTCFAVISTPVQRLLGGGSPLGRPALRLGVLLGAVLGAIGTTGVACAYPVVAATLVHEALQASAERRTERAGQAGLVVGAVLAQGGAHLGWVPQALPRTTGDLVAVVLLVHAVSSVHRTARLLRRQEALSRALSAEQRRRHEELQHAVDHDPVTGLLSRRGVAAHLRDAARRAAPGAGAAVVFCDLDGFKAVNDTHGHDAGDELLRAVAARFGPQLRPGDVLARTGGDEFVAVLRDVPSEAVAQEVAGRLERSLAAPVRLAAGEVVVGVSAGTAWTDRARADAAVGADDLLRRADALMYRRKRERRRVREAVGS